MIRPFLSSIFLSLLCVSSPTLAVANSIPMDLIYQGKPIDSLCFIVTTDKTIKVDLRHCGAKQQKYNIKPIDTKMSEKGYLGYNWKDPSMPDVAQGYSYYRFFPGGDQKYWIYTINNSGGSGEFTGLTLVTRIDSNTISLQNIAGGDRCNGGIQDVMKKNDALTFSVNLTPYDLIALSNVKIKNLKAYDDLAACAVCCAAKAFYTLDKGSPQFNYVELGKVKDTTEMPDQGKYQACFNKLFVSYINKNENKFNQEKIDTFTDQFKNSCISTETSISQKVT